MTSGTPDTPSIQCKVPGDLTSTTVPAFRAEVDQKLAQTVKDSPGLSLVEIDLKGARMVDSVGLNLLVSVIKQVKDRGGAVRILIAHPNIQRILTFTRIDKHAEVKMS
ncbi:MAG: STAS domain-containing protein [Opitutaceae bacterium]|jgi:anti-anti-sigma factor